jgi:hypothetical protein
MKSDLAGLEAQLSEVQASIDQEDYFGARDKALSIKEKLMQFPSRLMLLSKR